MRTLIKNAVIVNEGRSFNGSLVVTDDVISEIIEGDSCHQETFGKVIDAAGLYLIPGVIDEHVHFREPGLTAKADMKTESRAAAYGGVTSFFDMPNTKPQTVTLQALEDKFAIAAQSSAVNYSFFFGVTNDNVCLFPQLDVTRIPGLKLFMGSSTGNMLVDDEDSLNEIFAKSTIPVMTHCEDTRIINENAAKARQEYGGKLNMRLHETIRSEEACYKSTLLAVTMARKYGTRLHVAHVSTAKELELFGHDDNITAEAVMAHILFTDADYDTKGAFVKCNPAVKTAHDRDAIRQALVDGRITTVATDHAPHLEEDKKGDCLTAASGMPFVQFSLPAMLQLVDEGVLDITRVVQLMCHNPAQLFDVDRRGFIRKGYKADLVLVGPHSRWTVTRDIIQSKCGWSPAEGFSFNWKVMVTMCNGHVVYDRGKFDENYRGKEVVFRKH